MGKIFDICKRIARKNYYLELCGYLIQNNFFPSFLNTSGEVNIDSSLESYYARGQKLAKTYLEHCPFPLKDKVALELGPGYSLAACYELAKLGECKAVYAYDYGDFLDHKMDNKLKEMYDSNIVARVKYITQLDDLKDLKNSVDYIVSTAVLEHVWNFSELLEILDFITNEESIMFHQIDFGNHNKFTRYGELYFLSFSSWLWEKMAKNVAQPNRILYNDMKRLFESYGFYWEALFIEKYPKEVVEKALQTYLRKKFSFDDFENLQVKQAKVLIRCSCI